MSGKFLLAFDFDHTIIDDNSDLYVKRLAPDGVIPQEIEDQYSDQGWTEYMGAIFKYLHSHGVKEEKMRDCICEIPLTEGINELIQHVFDKCHEVIIISDSNSTFIDYTLTKFNLRHCVSNVYTNPATYDKDGCLRIKFYHTQDWCDLSTINLCKGHILQEHIKQRKCEGTEFSHIFFVGDGSNDLCPSLTLRDQDYVCPRIKFSLWKKLNRMQSSEDKEGGKLSLKANIINWKTGFDVLEFIKRFEGST